MIMEKKILTLDTGLFEDADIIINACPTAQVVQLKPERMNEQDWDDLLEKILEADLIVSA